MSNMHCTFLTKSYSVSDLSLTEVDYQDDFPFESCQLSNHKFPLAHFKKEALGSRLDVLGTLNIMASMYIVTSDMLMHYILKDFQHFVSSVLYYGQF